MASRSRCRPRRVCLFGTSADPPTGTAGHVGIVQTLAALPDHAFDEIRVLPVYRHTFAVSLVPYSFQGHEDDEDDDDNDDFVVASSLRNHVSFNEILPPGID